MADSNFRGPITNMGSMEVQSGNTATIEPFDGPVISYQGMSIPDIREVPFAKDGTAPGRVGSFLSLNDFYGVDNIPQAASTTLIAAAQVATAATALAITTAQVAGSVAGSPSMAIGVPVLLQGTTVVTSYPIVLDFGFATGTTTSNSTTVAVNDNTLFSLGQWIVVGGAANSAGSKSLIAQVMAIATANTTGISISLAAANTSSHLPIAGANLFGSGLLPPATQFGPSAPAATAWSKSMVAGLARVRNPREFIARNVSVTAGTTAATTAFTITGIDVWDQLMTEQITFPSGNRNASTIFGKKAFKGISSIVPTTSVASNFSIGVGDVFGFPVRADEWEQTQVFWNGCQVPTSLGFTAAASTAPATNTTGDVRGTIQVSTNGTGTAAAVATATVSNNTSRLVAIQNPGVWNQIFGTPLNTVPMFGVTNSTT